MSIKKTKRYGITEISASIKDLAFNINKKNKKHKILAIREKLKSELLKSKITIKNIKDIKEIDNVSIDKKLIIYINPYYELAFVKTLKSFPINTESLEIKQWLNNFEYYLTLHMMYWHDYNKLLESTKKCSYTQQEVYYFMDILINYYDLENPQKSLIEKNPKYLYYNIKPNLIANLEKDINLYEQSMVLKSIKEKKNYADIKNNVYLDEKKYNEIKNNIISSNIFLDNNEE